MSRIAGLALVAVLMVLVAAFPARAQVPDPPKTPVAEGNGGSAATVDPLATQAAIDTLRSGGNAVDAAVAAAGVLGVVEPFSCGIGGGGFMVVYSARNHKVDTIDSREEAPAGMTETSFLASDGTPLPFAEARVGGLSVGVPGTVSGWETALNRYGTRRLSSLLRPAERIARRGFTIDATFNGQVAANADLFDDFPASADLYLTPEGAAKPVGSVQVNRDLARTYERIGRNPDRFYRGGIARDISQTVRHPPAVAPDVGGNPRTIHAGSMTAGDLAQYDAIRRDPTRIRYRGLDIYGMAPPSSGGSTIGEALNIMEGFPRAEARDLKLHQYLEASKLAYADRGKFLGDPAFVDVPLRGLLSDGFAAERRSLITDTALPAPQPPGDPLPFNGGGHGHGYGKVSSDAEGPSTTHLTVADRWGNVVTYTFTIEQIGGSGITVPGRGFLLNNELTDFNFTAGTANSPAPGKRPRSSMAPTMVFDHGRVAMALGSPGGSTIITTVLQILVNSIDFRMSLPDALAAPRASQRNSATTDAEPAFLAHDGPALEARGHKFVVPVGWLHRGGHRDPLPARRPPAVRGGADAARRRLGDGGETRLEQAVRGRTYRSAMLDIEDRLAELAELGLYRRMRMVSGPQGPRVVLDGKPVLLLCSGNHLGLADHPRVREAAADAAMRWGAGAGAARPASGTMTLHRRLEERLADFLGTPAALLFGSGYLATLGIVPALAQRGELVFADALCHASVADACRLSEAETVIYDHGDVDQLAWRLRNADGRAALIVTEGVFALDGDIAPLEAIAALAHRFDVRLMVSEAHGLGAVGPDGRGAIAAAGLRGQVDVIVGSLGSALGAAGGYAACDRMLARYLAAHARTFAGSTALPPPAAAAAMAALELLREQPRRVEKLQANADCLRTELAREGFDVAGADAHVISIVVGEPRLAVRIAELALEQGVYIGAVLPPDVAEGCARLRLSVMASHTKSELRDAARVLGRAALRAGFRPATGIPLAAAA